MLEEIDSAARSKARAAMRGLLRSGIGTTLPPCRPRGRAGRSARALAAVGGFLILLALGALGALFLLLGSGPINLATLNPRIAQSLEERLGDRYTVSIGSTYLMRTDGGIALGFGGITLRDRAGRSVLSAPRGRVDLDALSLLALGVKVRRLELDGLDLRLHLRQDGALSIAAAGDPSATTIEMPAPSVAPPEQPSAPDFGLLVFRVIDAMTGASQSLDRVALVHGHLVIENDGLARPTVYDDLAIAFDKNGDDATIQASAQGPAGRWSVEAQARGGDSRAVTVTARDLSFADLVSFHAGRMPFDTDMPISFKLEARLTPTSAIQSLEGRLSLGAGYFKLDDPDHEPFLVDEATGEVSWNREAGRYDFK
ncbi:MAG: hypothetical protein JO107_05670, partial [Hyphomicrobiales bacterium]|nr:hypothetical protein [Hyphomicrobiales bacterium]